MATPYLWRQLTDSQRVELMVWRKSRQRPWHTPPHRPDFGKSHFHITAACYEHAAIIGRDAKRIDKFSEDLLETFASSGANVSAWSVLPNHYHAAIETPNVLKVLHALGRLHGRTSFAWNSEDRAKGRKVFHGAVERTMRTERHYWATLNYVHNNAVRHGYTKNWFEWPWSSAAEFIALKGRDEAERIWRAYPVRDYGDGWDDPNL